MGSKKETLATSRANPHADLSRRHEGIIVLAGSLNREKFDGREKSRINPGVCKHRVKLEAMGPARTMCTRFDGPVTRYRCMKIHLSIILGQKMLLFLPILLSAYRISCRLCRMSYAALTCPAPRYYIWHGSSLTPSEHKCVGGLPTLSIPFAAEKYILAFL